MGNVQQLLFQDEATHREQLLLATGPEGSLAQAEAAVAAVKRIFVNKDLEYEAVMVALREYLTREWPQEKATPLARASRSGQLEVHHYLAARIEECDRLARNLQARETHVAAAKRTLSLKHMARDFGISRRDVGSRDPLGVATARRTSREQGTPGEGESGSSDAASDNERVEHAKSVLESFRSKGREKNGVK